MLNKSLSWSDNNKIMSYLIKEANLQQTLSITCMRLGGACMCDINIAQVHIRPHILRYKQRFIMTYKYKKELIPNQCVTHNKNQNVWNILTPRDAIRIIGLKKKEKGSCVCKQNGFII